MSQRLVALAAAMGLILALIVAAVLVVSSGDGDDSETTTTVAGSPPATTAVAAPITETTTSSPAKTSTSTAPSELVLEAEAGEIVAPMAEELDPTASGGALVSSPTFGEGSVTLPFVVQGGTYAVWARASAGSVGPTASDSFDVAVDGAELDTWDLFETLGDPPVNWSWDAVSLRCGGTFEEHGCDPWHLELAPGQHAITFQTRDLGTRLDVVVITADLDWQPVLDPSG